MDVTQLDDETLAFLLFATEDEVYTNAVGPWNDKFKLNAQGVFEAINAEYHSRKLHYSQFHVDGIPVCGECGKPVV